MLLSTDKMLSVLFIDILEILRGLAINSYNFTSCWNYLLVFVPFVQKILRFSTFDVLWKKNEENLKVQH